MTNETKYMKKKTYARNNTYERKTRDSEQKKQMSEPENR